MSLLINESYVNPDTSLWVSKVGDTISGNLTVDGTLAVDGPAQFFGGGAVKIANPSTLYLANTGQSQPGLLLYSDNAATPNGYAETNGTVYLGRVGAGNTANSTFVPSAPATNGDVLTVGGRITSTGILAGPSVTPFELITTPKVVSPVSTLPAEDIFTNDADYPTAIGETYEVAFSGRVFLRTGTPDPDDVVYVKITAGATYPGSIWVFPVFPEAVGVAGLGLYNHVIRVKSDLVLPSMTLSVGQILAGTSTAVYEAAVYTFTATRVA